MFMVTFKVTKIKLSALTRCILLGTIRTLFTFLYSPTICSKWKRIIAFKIYLDGIILNYYEKLVRVQD